MEPVPRRFRWPRALLHVGLVIFATNGIAMAFAMAGMLDARRWGEMSIEFMLTSGAFTLLASYGRQTGRPVVFGLGALLAAAAAFGWIPALLIGSHRAQERNRMTAAETATFERRGDELCQPALGVALADPGATLEVDPALAGRYNEVFAKQEWLHSWVWLRRGGGLLHLQAGKGPGSDWLSFAAFIADVRERVVRPGSTVEAEAADSRARPYQYRLAYRRKGAALDVYCRSTSDAEALAMIVCAQTVALDHEALRSLRESMATGGCR
jgi:hypothetical protein